MTYGFAGAVAALITVFVVALTRRPGRGRRPGAQTRFRRRMEALDGED